ncbi:MAG: putative acetyltransferase [Symbiobacteriaceae bacterium]|jgi:RimJ/RimL family protein N-acetyltransferase|nr:putative acetyltransferase [Symbiobacteriaceae bacterium]
MYYAERVRLRRVNPELDTDDRYRWLNDPDTVRYLGMRPARLSREEVRSYLEKCADSARDIAEFAIETSDGCHIGGTCLRAFNHTARSAEFGICIGEEDFRGQGYGTEVTRLMVKIGFEEFNLNRIWLHVSADNPAGVRAYEKAGFQREGWLRQHGFINGKYYDAYLMAVLREEYERRERGA